MSGREYEKVVVVAVLEAVKTSLGHLSRMKIECGGSNNSHAHAVTHIYARLRRLRDYLQRSVAAYPNQVTVDLPPEDERLLCSCILLDLGEGELRTIRAGRAGKDQSWRHERVKLQSQFALELADRAIDPLPGMSESSLRAKPVRELLQSLKDKPQGGPAMLSGGFYHGSADAESGSQLDTDPIPFEIGESPAPARATSAASPATPDHGVDRDPIPMTVTEATPSQQSPEAPDGGVEATSGEPHLVGESCFLLDPKRMRDPRLRSILVLDMRALARSRADRDYRVAAVHLLSVLEAVALDYALPRASELSLVGPPETWKTGQILERVFGGELEDSDRAILRPLLLARSMLRPGKQLRDPMTVTGKAFERMLGLTRQILAFLGLTGHVHAES